MHPKESYTEGNKGNKKILKEEFKRLTFNNIDFCRRKEGLIILLYGDTKSGRKYGGNLYLNMEPNNTKLITRGATSSLFWLKYSPCFGHVNIVVDGWLQNIPKGMETSKIGKVFRKNGFQSLEKMFLGGGIRVIKIFLNRDEDALFKEIEKCNSEVFPWNEVRVKGDEVEDMINILKSINDSLEELSPLNYEMEEERNSYRPQRVKNRGYDDNKDTAKRIEKKYSQCINEFIKHLQKSEKKLVLVFEGLDASGKGSAIKNVFKGVSPKKYDLYRISEPYRNEKKTHFLKRFIPKVFNNKPVMVFDRSWYGRVLVEKVEKLDVDEHIENSYDIIANFEKELQKSNIHLIKIWMDISDEEQLRRFKRRTVKPNKRWKIEENDWKNRMKREQYRKAAEIMMEKTSNPYAPWIIIPGDNKKNAKIAIKREIMDYIENTILK